MCVYIKHCTHMSHTGPICICTHFVISVLHLTFCVLAGLLKRWYTSHTICCWYTVTPHVLRESCLARAALCKYSVFNFLSKEMSYNKPGIFSLIRNFNNTMDRLNIYLISGAYEHSQLGSLFLLIDLFHNLWFL